MKIISGTLYTVFILLLLGVAGLFLASMLPIPGNIEVKIVKSGSMEPAILTGSVVVVKPAASYAVGDIITFGEDTGASIPTTHRIIAINGDFNTVSYQTMGDANEEADPQLVMERDVIGKVVLAAPYAGYVLDFARQPIGFTLMIGIPAAIIILDELGRIWREVRSMRGGDAATPAKRREEDEKEDSHYALSAYEPRDWNIKDAFEIPNIRSMDGIRPRLNGQTGNVQ